MYQVDEDREWKTIGQLRKFLNFFDNQKIKFHRIRFQIAGASRSEPPVFLGIETYDGINEGLIRT